MLTMDAKSSGLPCNPIWGQRLLPFYPGKAGYLGALNTMTSERRILHVDIMPGEFAHLVERRFFRDDDYGFRLLPMLTKLEYGVIQENGQDIYLDEAYTYFDVVHPILGECPYGLFRDEQMSDPEVGESTPVWQPCPTCRLAHLKSQEVSDRIFEASSELDSSILASLRTALIESNEATLRHIARKSQMVQGDIARKMTGSMPGRNVLNTIDLIHLKMMHKTVEKGSDQSEFARIIASAITETRQPMQQEINGVVISHEEAEMLAQYKQRQAQAAKMRAGKEKKNESSIPEGDETNN